MPVAIIELGSIIATVANGLFWVWWLKRRYNTELITAIGISVAVNILVGVATVVVQAVLPASLVAWHLEPIRKSLLSPRRHLLCCAIRARLALLDRPSGLPPRRSPARECLATSWRIGTRSGISGWVLVLPLLLSSLLLLLRHQHHRRATCRSRTASARTIAADATRLVGHNHDGC